MLPKKNEYVHSFKPGSSQVSEIPFFPFLVHFHHVGWLAREAGKLAPNTATLRETI